MNTITRKNNILASYLYLVSLTFYIIPTIYAFLNPVGPMPAPLFVVVALTLLLGFLIALGLQLRAGKMWAKVLVLLNAVGMNVFCLYAFPTLFQSSLFTILRTLTFFALNLATIWFLFRAYRATYSADLGESQV